MNTIKIIVSLIGLLLVATAAADAGDFHIYAPGRGGQVLWIVKASVSGDDLTLKVEKKVPLGLPGGTIVAHPDKPLLYVATSSGSDGPAPGAVVTLNENGTHAGVRKVELARGYAYLSLDRSNRFLMGANYRGGKVDIYKLDEDAAPIGPVTALDEDRTFAHSIQPSPDNAFVYIPYVKDKNAIFQYRFDPSSGALTPLEPTNAEPPEGTGPRHIAYHPSLPIVYFSNEQHLGVSVYEQKPDGQLALRQVCDALPADDPKDGASSSDLTITPDGRFVFAGIRGHKRDIDSISRYRVTDHGELEFLGLTPADKIPWGLALSPDGRFLLVSATEGASLSAYLIGDDGSLEKVDALKWEAGISDLVTRGSN